MKVILHNKKKIEKENFFNLIFFLILMEVVRSLKYIREEGKFCKTRVLVENNESRFCLMNFFLKN